MSLSVDINGQGYRINTIPAMRQFHVARRLAGVLSGLTGASGLADLARGEGDPFAALGPVAEGIAAMSDADAEYVINTCLDVVERAQPSGGWAAVRSGGQLMFEDLDMPTMLQLTWRVLQHNLSGFMAVLPQASPGTDQT